MSGKDGFLIPFSILWGGFAIFWNALVWLAPFEGGDAPGWFFKLFGLPFLVFGIYLIAGRFFHDARIRSKLFYAVTDRRILILNGSRFTSLDIQRLPRLDLTEHRDGTGTLAFEASNIFSPGSMNGFAWWVPSLGSAAQFFRIQSPRHVYEIIRNHSLS